MRSQKNRHLSAETYELTLAKVRLAHYLKHELIDDASNEKISPSIQAIAAVMQTSTYKVNKYLYLSTGYGADQLREKLVAHTLRHEHVSLLTSVQTLRQQATMSLTDRCHDFEKQHPGTSLSKTKLRRIYFENEIKLRVIQKKIVLCPSQLLRQTRCRLHIFPRLLRLEEWGVKPVYVDEAVFSKRLNVQSVWQRPKDEGIMLNFHAVNFTAVAACVGVDSDGVIRAYTLEDFSIDRYKFVTFLSQLRDNHDRTQTLFVVVDQLKVHYTDVVKDFCDQNNIVLVYNASYSSEFMPAEIVWAISKKAFRKKLIEKDRSKLTPAIVRTLISQSIEGSSQQHVRLHTMKCLQRMRQWLESYNLIVRE